jgi:hypothetical protein
VKVPNTDLNSRTREPAEPLKNVVTQFERKGVGLNSEGNYFEDEIRNVGRILSSFSKD